MNPTPRNSSCLRVRGPLKVLLTTTLVLAAALGLRAQTTYTWLAASSTKWTTLTDWSPTISNPSNEYPLGPGSLDTITNGTNTENLQVDNSGTTSGGGTVTTTPIGELDTGSAASWTIENGTSSGTGNATLDIGTLRVGLNGVTKLAFIDNTGNTSGYTLGVNVSGNTYVTDGSTLNVGNTGSTTGQELAAFSAAGTLNLGGTSTVNLNVTGSASLGLIDATDSTANKVVLIENSDANHQTVSRTIAVTGLEGGTVSVVGGGGTYGGAATLEIANGGTTNYTAAATLGNGSGTNASLALLVNLTGGAGAAQTLTGTSTYTGGTTISAGTLYVDNTSGSGVGSGAVTVASGGNLAGNGTISIGVNAVTVNGTLTPGNASAAGTLTLGTGATTLVFGSGATLAETLGTSSTSVIFGGTAANSVSGLAGTTLDITEGAGFQDNVAYTVIGNGTTAVQGSSYDLSAVYLNGVLQSPSQYLLGIDGSNDYTFLEEQAVPEPATWSLLLGGAVLVWSIARRRTRFPLPRAAVDFS